MPTLAVDNRISSSDTPAEKNISRNSSSVMTGAPSSF